MTRRTHATDPRIVDGRHRARALQLTLRVILLVVLVVALVATLVAYRALAATGGVR